MVLELDSSKSALQNVSLPQFLPDETLYSWCARYHRLAVNGLASVTCQQLFGHRQIGAAHDLPARIDVFVRRSGGVLGSAKQIIQAHTLLPYYLPFKDKALAENAVNAMRSDSIGSLKFQIGLLTSGLGAAHPLKSCLECMQVDQQEFGWRYWHREHQLPGVWVCRKHNQLLHVSMLKVDQIARFEWILPGSSASEPLVVLSQETATQSQRAWLIKLASISQELLRYPAAAFADPEQISACIRSRLQDFGLTGPRGRVRWPEIQSWIAALAGKMLGVPELQRQNGTLLRRQLSRVLAGRALAHPLRYLIWITTWFDGMVDFNRGYQAAGDTMVVLDSVSKKPSSGGRSNGEAESRRYVLEAIVRGDLSITAASRVMGVAYATVAGWAAKAQIMAPRRPKVLDDDRWNTAVAALRAGEDKIVVAERSGIALVTVTRILRNVPGLQVRWHQVRHEKRQVTARQAWEDLVQRYAQLGIKALREMGPSTYAWLYRNDREWLNQSLSGMTPLTGGNNAESRMQRADAHLTQVLQSVIRASSAKTEEDLLRALVRDVPASRNVLRHPARWPMAARVIEVALQHRLKKTW